MAKANVQGGKRGRKAAIKAAQSNGAAAVAELPEENEEQEEIEPEPPPPPAPPRRTRQKDAPPKFLEFFRKLSTYPLADWGTRVKVKVYRLEPITNQLLATGKKYVAIYMQPPVDEERIKQDAGSGRYRLYLNYKAPAEGEKEIDSVEIDILDMRYPPKVPKGAWLDDPRNQEWAWAREFYDKQGAQPAVPAAQGPTMLETIDTVLDVAERLKPTPAAPAQTAVQELNTLVAVAEKLRPPETVPAFMQTQFTALQAQITAAQERADKLMLLLLEDRRKGSTSSDGVSVIKEVVGGLKELVPTVKEFFPEGIGNGGGGGSRLNGWQEFAVALGNSPAVSSIISPLAGALAGVLVGRFTGGARPGQPPAPPPAYQPPAPHQPPSQPAALPGAELMPFLAMIAPPMCNYIRTMAIPGNEPEAMGKDFAGWVFDGYGGDPRYMEAIQAARMMGPAGIITAFQSVPLWKDKGPNGMMVSLEELQAKLPAFFTAFLNYDPNAEDETEEDEEEETGPPEVVTYREANA